MNCDTTESTNSYVSRSRNKHKHNYPHRFQRGNPINERKSKRTGLGALWNDRGMRVVFDQEQQAIVLLIPAL